MMNYATKNSHREVIGVFFGITEPNGDIKIRNAYPFRIGKRAEVQFEDSDYEKLYPIIKENDKLGYAWLGWFHSHPFKGDSLYMSQIDYDHQIAQQTRFPYWTAIIVNPNQISDKNTTQGARAFRLNLNSEEKEYKKMNLLNLTIV